MTKEQKQAIEYLKTDIKYWEDTSVSTDHLIMAIKALERLEQLEERLEKIKHIINATEYIENDITYSYCYNQERKVKEIREVLENIGE